MSNSQGPGGGALEQSPFGGFGPPPNSGNKHYSPPTTSSNGLTDLTAHHHHHHHPHLTLLKTSSSNNHNSIGLPPNWFPVADPEGLGTRLSDAFSEMRYLELNNWDLSGYPTAEGLTARLVDARSIDSSDQPINYRPWEKPDSSSNGGGGGPQTTTTTSAPVSGTNTNTTTTTTNGPSSRHDDVTTSSTPNGVSSTNGEEKNSPPTLTPLTNAFPNFTEAFVPAGQKLPSFQSQFNSFTDQPIAGHITHIVEGPPGSGLPSFHTLPANGRYVPGSHPGAGQHHPGHHHMVAASPMTAPRDQQPFLEERHIQLFPGQVPLAPGQFSQLIATSSPATSTMTITNGHHIHSPHAYHPAMTLTNGTGTTNSFGGNATTVMTSSGATTLQLQELVPGTPMHTILHPNSAAAAAVAAAANSSSTHKLAQPITTDGSIPGLNLNLIEPHHHPHSHAQHPHHFTTSNGNGHLGVGLNLPKYLTTAPDADGNIQAHLIAVKLPNSYEHVAQAHQGMLAQHQQSQSLHAPPPHHTPTGPHHPQHHHHNSHPITKLDHHQRSPQINVGVNTNGGSVNGQVNNNSNGTPSTPKRQGKRKRAENPGSNGIHNNNNGHISQHNNHHLVDSPNSAHQVSSVSSTESSFKRPNLGHNGTNGKINGNGLSNGNMSDGGGSALDKQNKKKRKRCGECVGCSRKDNCGECAPCRNDKSHQICKQRRCDTLTEKKTPKSKLKQQQQQQQPQQTQQLQQHH